VEAVSHWWLIPLSKWVIIPVTNGISRVNLLIYNWGELTHLLYKWDEPPSIVLEFDLENVDKCGDHIRDFNIFQALEGPFWPKQMLNLPTCLPTSKMPRASDMASSATHVLSSQRCWAEVESTVHTRYFPMYLDINRINPITLILNTPIAWSQWNVEIPY